MSSGVRVPSETAVHTLLEIILDNHSQTKTHVRSKFKRAYAQAPYAMYDIVLCRKTTKTYPLGIIIPISIFDAPFTQQIQLGCSKKFSRIPWFLIVGSPLKNFGARDPGALALRARIKGFPLRFAYSMSKKVEILEVNSFLAASWSVGLCQVYAFETGPEGPEFKKAIRQRRKAKQRKLNLRS